MVVRRGAGTAVQPCLKVPLVKALSQIYGLLDAGP